MISLKVELALPLTFPPFHTMHSPHGTAIHPHQGRRPAQSQK